MNTSGLLKKLLSSNADDVASRLSSKYVDDAARAAQGATRNIRDFLSAGGTVDEFDALIKKG